MTKNVYSRMNIAITNVCNQKCAYCFEGNWKRQKPLQFISLDNFDRLLRWRDWSTGRIPILSLYGGEPTLHPQLSDIVNMTRAYNPKISIRLYTNLVCENDIIQEMIFKEVQIVPNVDQFEKDNNTYNTPLIIKNLDYLNSLPPNNKYNITVTVSHPQKDFTFLYEILERGKDHISNLKVTHSSPGSEFKNKFQKELNYDTYAKVLEVVTRCKEISPSLTFASGCPVNYCLISDQLLNQLEKLGYRFMRFCGEFGPNADILPDLSCHRCFAFQYNPEMSIKNVLEYPNYDSMIEALESKKLAFQHKYPMMCDKGKCNYANCEGLCPALNYYQYSQEAKMKR